MSTSASTAQHNQLMATLVVIQSTQTDILKRIERLEEICAVALSASTSQDHETPQESQPRQPQPQELQPTNTIQGSTQSTEGRQEEGGREEQGALTVPPSSSRKRHRVDPEPQATAIGWLKQAEIHNVLYQLRNYRRIPESKALWYKTHLDSGFRFMLLMAL